MSYLIPSKGKLKNAAHLWTGDDTFCKMLSTGGLRLRRGYRVTETPEGRRICMMCDTVKTRRELDDRFVLVVAKEA